MQKGKHQGGQTQGYPARNYPTYPGNPENSRQYSRGEVPAFHASGTPGGGPGMRGMHHAPPTQPPTPPTSQDIKQTPAHLPPQGHQMPPQSGGQMMQYGMPGTGRGGTQQTPFYNPPRAPPSSQRMTTHARQPVVVSNSAQSFMSQPVVQPVYQGHMLSTQMSGQGPMFVAPPINQPFQIQQPRHQSGAFYQAQQILMPPHAMFTHYPQQTMYYHPLQSMSRAGGPAPNSQGGAPAQPQPQPPLTLMGHNGAMISNPGVSQHVKTSRPKKRLDIIDPNSGKNLWDEMNDNDNTSSRSGESSARQTPQPPVTLINPDTGRDVINDFKNEISSSKLQGSCERIFPQPNAGQKTDQGVAADFATRVAIAARGDHSGSPNASTHQQPSSRTSNYSESESQASPDPQGMSTPSVSPSKLDTSVESISSESQIVENNIAYDSNQQTPLLRGAWIPGGNMPAEMLPMSLHAGMMIADDMMRGGPIPNQPAREYQAVQTPWITEGNPVPVIISKELTAPIESPVRPTPERVTPVVSALAQGPTVEIGPRPQREQFPALGKGHQQQSPVKRKQRSEQTQEQGDGKVKDQQPKAVTQTKPKSVTPTAESKKQPMQPSQDSDEYVQSVQTKNNEPKTIIIKKNDSDSSGTKTKCNDSLKSKESNNLETRNLNEEIVQDNNRNKSENTKCEVPVTKENSPSPAAEEPTGKAAVEEIREKVPPVPVPASEIQVVSAPVEDGPPLKANGETTEEAKSNNQKSKPGNKRPAQAKMRLESKDKDSRNAEPETPAIEVTSSATSVPEAKNSAPSTAVSNEKLEKAQEDTISVENSEKEDLIVATKNEENSKQTTSMKTNDSTHASAAPNKLVLKHNYEAGQWSPLNPEGKKKYDRQFILDLQNEPQSLRKPTHFPNLELLNDNSKQRPFDRNVINSMSRSHVDSLYPSFAANKGSSQRGGQAITKRGSQQGKAKAAKPTVVQVSLLQDVKLHETENAWKPTRITESSNKSEEEAKTEELYRRVRGILNKLTPEKFNLLVQQVKELPIDNPTRLKGVIDLVFKKAVDEPSFSVAYAQMCSVLQRMEVPSATLRSDGKPEPVNFRNLLLGRCQQEFEKNTAAELKRDERLSEIEEEKDPEKKKALQLSFEEEERKIRMRSVGNIRFIGELYKMYMLTCPIMHSCINQLLNQGDEESLECLCKLLTTIGEGLESKEKANKGNNEKGKAEGLNSYFKKLEQIVKNKRSGKVSSRVRFMIQDLIDLRNNKWVPRRNESQPKTIDQIQKEAERENIEMNIALNSHRENTKRQDMRNSLDNRKREKVKSGGTDSGGWTVVSQSQQNKTKFIDYDKLKLDQSDVESVSLGNRNQFMWAPGGSGGKSDDKRSMSQLGGNKFALLSTSSSGYSSLKGTSEKERMNSYKSTEDEMGSSKSSSQQDSRSSSRDSASSKRDDNRFIGSGKRGSLPPQPSVPSNEEPRMNREELEKIAKRILDDYLTSLDPNEVSRDLAESWKCSLKELVPYISLEAMERRASDLKRGVGIIMSHLIKRKEMSKDDFLVGLSKVLETADDLAIDLPLVWKYLAEILVDMFAEEVITFKDIVPSLAPIKGSPGSAKFLDALVNLLIETKDAAWLEQKWMQSQVKLTDIIDEKDVNDFVKQNKVEFMLIKAELSRMITARASFDEITAWITKNVGDQKSSEPSFVRTLMTVLLEASVTKGQSGSYKLDTGFLSGYEPLIVRYANHKEELELPCLFAVQAFVHKLEYPQAILYNIFNHLWDGGFIASESFKSWRDSKDPHEQEGHAVCVTSLTSFFTLLNETETEDES